MTNEQYEAAKRRILGHAVDHEDGVWIDREALASIVRTIDALIVKERARCAESAMWTERYAREAAASERRSAQIRADIEADRLRLAAWRER